MTTTPIRDAVNDLAADLRLAVILRLAPIAFDMALVALAWRAGTPAGLLATWAHPATRYVDRLDLHPHRGARP